MKTFQPKKLISKKKHCKKKTAYPAQILPLNLNKEKKTFAMYEYITSHFKRVAGMQHP